MQLWSSVTVDNLNMASSSDKWDSSLEVAQMVGPGWLESTDDWTSKQVFLFLFRVQQTANEHDQQGVGIGLASFLFLDV